MGRHGKSWELFSLAAVLCGAAPNPVTAQNDSLLAAIGFALTGSDHPNIQFVDRAECVVILNGGTTDGQSKSEIFHLNNVEVDRLNIRQLSDKFGVRWMEAELHGDGVVYQFTGQYRPTDPKSFLPPDMQLAFQKQALPPEAFDWEIKVYTDETARYVRAWQYIYTNGCKAKNSPF